MKKIYSLLAVVALTATATAQNTFQQDFSSSSTVADYVNTPAVGTTDKFDGITTSNSGSVWSIDSGALKIARTGNAAQFARLGVTGDTNAEVLSVQFDLSVSSSSSTTNAAAFYIGSGYSATANSAPSNASSNSRLGVNFSTTSGTFQLRNIAGSSNSANLTGVQKLTWIINNTSSEYTYTAPDGSTQTVAASKSDVWAGNAIVFDEMVATTSGVALQDLKFAISNGTGSLTVDNFVIKALPVPTMSVGDVKNGKANLVKNTIVSNELIFGAAAKVSVINMNGQVVKTAEVSENSRLDVSSLVKGTYVVTGVVNGQSVSQKIIKK
ncbi:T9SS type A sorting domain-containing protein [Epilithonimonas xixisoli]|uniref:Putative secreted protein (Por secretion system target) n=1 Tax=Epilithonimonas xixisoli TaxID=1476462 RepID=A0A4R8I8K4_9FLAO|nr:T9SS type A sorting domain-containing protein [Epilithonimonas xixisoli]TDX86297.1 putative secreted protein (Por secretion system target) [Epilithonimonas xixisoli]